MPRALRSGALGSDARRSGAQLFQASLQRGEPRIVVHAGRSLMLSAWARELGWSPQALAYRLDVMPQVEAMTPRSK